MHGASRQSLHEPLRGHWRVLRGGPRSVGRDAARRRVCGAVGDARRLVDWRVLWRRRRCIMHACYSHHATQISLAIVTSDAVTQKPLTASSRLTSPASPTWALSAAAKRVESSHCTRHRARAVHASARCMRL